MIEFGSAINTKMRLRSHTLLMCKYDLRNGDLFVGQE